MWTRYLHFKSKKLWDMNPTCISDSLTYLPWMWGWGWRTVGHSPATLLHLRSGWCWAPSRTPPHNTTHVNTCHPTSLHRPVYYCLQWENIPISAEDPDLFAGSSPRISQPDPNTAPEIYTWLIKSLFSTILKKFIRCNIIRQLLVRKI